jgi:MYXO-CTERM domain-containing protein
MLWSTRLFVTAAFASTWLTVTPARAVTTEPNGLQIPLDSMNGETQLYTKFAQLGEPIDWLADAASKPDTFSPLCGFTATFILNQAGSHFGLAWYNANGVAPTAADLHTIVPPNSPVGTMIMSADIKNDPAYTNGLIGFALVGGQTHYSEQQWDPVCSGCNPAAPWISAVIYASKNTPNAYYLAFEDGNFGSNPNNFGNDGDFNDDVFFLTGLTCAGGGQPCDTGKPGICGPGLTECTANGIVCKGQSAPAPMESCNGVDDDCNGATDEGDLCPVDFLCIQGSCQPKCNKGEFVCPDGLVCDAGGVCVDPACANVTCPMGKACIAGVCKAPCDDVKCPFPQDCRVGVCVDPCDGVQCDAGQVCELGVCITRCDCSPCVAGKACDMANGHCEIPACVGKSCPMGQHCDAMGACVDNCMDAMCPTGQLCMMGQCIKDPNPTGAGGGSMSGSGGSMTGAGGSMSNSSGTGGAKASGGANASGGADPGTSSGCGCMVGDTGSSEGAVLALGALGLVIAARRRTSAARR